MPIEFPGFKAILKYATGVFLLIYIAFSVDLETAFSHLNRLSAQQILIIFAASFLLLACQAWRLHTLIAPYTQHYITTLNLSFISQLFSNFLPGGMAGDIYKIIFLKKKNSSTTAALTYIALDRLVALLIFGIASLFLVPILYERRALLNTIIAIPPFITSIIFSVVLAGLLIFAAVPAVRSKVITFLKNAHDAYCCISIKQKSAFWVVSICTFIVRLINVYLIIYFFIPDFRWEYVIVVIFVIHFVAMVPISVGSLGALEGAMIMSLVFFGVPADIGTSIAIVYRISIWFLSLCGLFVWLFNKKDFTQKQVADV